MRIVLALFLFAAAPAFADHHEGPQLKDLLAAELEVAPGIEVFLSHVSLPPHTELPRHWHPGEEFAYVIEGSVVLWQEGKEDQLFEAGEASKVPLKQVHTAKTLDEGVTLIVFRVHQKGEPQRVLVDDAKGD